MTTIGGEETITMENFKKKKDRIKNQSNNKIEACSTF